MIFNNCLFILVVTLVCQQRLVEANAFMLRKFGILDKPRHSEIFTKAFIDFLVSTTKQHKSHKQVVDNEEIRQKIYRERLLNRVRGTVFKDFYSHLF